MVGGIVGGGFGGKSDLSVEPVIAVAALRTGRPVKWRWTMHEELQLPTVRGAFHLYYKTGIKKDGKIAAQYIRSIQDLGAFCYRGARITDRQGTVAGGPYRIPNYWYDGYGVHTNKVPAAALRGFGVAQVSFASEVHMSNIARSIGMDPIELRRINALGDGDTGFRGSVLERTGAKECLDAIESEYHEKKDAPAEKHLKRGFGVALTVMPIGLTAGVPPVSVNVYITPEGTLVLSVNTTDLGQGSRTTLAQIASQALGISENWISITRADSSLNPRGAGSGASQETYITGNAVKRAVEKIRRMCLEVAASHFKGRIEDLEMKDGHIYLIANRGTSMTLSELSAIAAEQGKVLMATGTYKTETMLPDESTGLGKPYEEYGYAAAYTQVLVDTETGQVKVERLVSAADAGKAVNPMAVEGQIEGGAAMNLGYALMEELYPAYPSDKFFTSDLHEYLIPTSCDIPPVESIIVEKASVKGPYGAKGLGEVTATAIAPAIANAIGDAVGLAPTQLPITSERLLSLLKKTETAEEVS
jgi:CO/xanthine dehydrogenase Mo-binding subunit